MLRICIIIALICFPRASNAGTLKAGAAAIDITPTEFPVIVNGMFEERTATKALDPLFAKCIVLDDGKMKIAIVVADSCMLPRDLLDEAKSIASKSTGIPTDRMCISATHTHSAPSSMGCLGSDADEKYRKFLIPLLAKSIEEANSKLVPARVGSGIAKAPDYNACRRWIFAPNQMRNDPFGFLTIRANMHPGYQNPGAMGPAGPTDPDITMLSLQTADGKPLALLANYAMHYFGSGMLSSDYFGLFAKKFAALAKADENFVAIMSQGCSGDMWWGDYSKPAAKKWTIDEYSEGMAKIAHEAYQKFQYTDSAPLAMTEQKLELRYRVADEKRLTWAKERVAALNGKKPTAQPDIYAREQLLLAENPQRHLKIQAIAIGTFAIAAIPNEVFAVTGLKIKGWSPFSTTMVIELANGAEGYIPPPEQHKLGGYTTWAARTAGLQVTAEPEILNTAVGSLEVVTTVDIEGVTKIRLERHSMAQKDGPYTKAILSSKPSAYYRMGTPAPWPSKDISENARDGEYESGVAFYLEGPQSPQFCGENIINRCPHFAGGRMKTSITGIKNQYSIELWFYNCLPTNTREVTGYLLSRGPDGNQETGDHLGIGGTFGSKGKLIFFNGNKNNEILAGNTDIPLRTWNHLVITRDGRRVAMYLNGNPEPDAISDVDITYAKEEPQFFIGGRNDNFANFEGKIDEVAIYDRALKSEEIAQHYKTSAMPARPNAQAIQRDSSPKSPQEALALLHVKTGYIIEQVACEPLVVDPVAIDWGADGRLWVAEMADYPYGIDGKNKPGGRIKFLTDTDGDGKYDKATLFMDEVRMPNGIIAWRNGVIVTAAPEIFYAEDTDGDGKADIKKVLYKGFKEGNPQLRVNSLRWGLDNWLHCANGWSGGVIESFAGGAKLDLGRSKDLRIRPDDGAMELESGVSQFGRNPDDWGNWFGCDNSHPLFHFVIEDRYLRRNPHVTPPDPKQQVITPANPRVYPLSHEGKRYHSFEHAGHYTSACSAMIYRDDLLFPRSDVEHSFTCEPVHNLVQHNLVRETGPTFTATHPDDETDHDFIASEDPWFRPVMARTGPDGALWIVDLYRYMIEHPDWLPPQGKGELMKYYRDGDERGRIYRVYPKDKKPRAIPNLSRLDTRQLVALLGYPNGWVRDKAQQMLIWKNDAAVIPRLEDLLFKGKVPYARLHALCTLDALDGLSDADMRMAFDDEHPAVRRAALRLCENPKRLPLIDSALKLIDDPDANVRLQLACTLGESPSASAGAALSKLALSVADDVYLAGAVSSSLMRHQKTVATALLKAPLTSPTGLYRDLLAMGLATDDREMLATLLEPLRVASDGGYSNAQMETLAAWHAALAQHHSSVQALKAARKDVLSERLELFTAVYDWAARVTVDPAPPPQRRALAASLLGRRPQKTDEDLKILSALLTPQMPLEVQISAVQSLAVLGGKQIPGILLQQWTSHSPTLRSAVADLLISREDWAMAFLAAIQSAKVAPADLDLPRRQRLMNHSAAQVKQLARNLLRENESNRQEVIDANRTVLSLTGDRTRGQKMFATHCATCHRMENTGNEIGPGLASVANWSGEALLTAILDPDRQVEPRYLSYTAKLNNNDEIFGIITAESGGGITLKGLDAKDQTILRSNIKSLTCTNHSLMPMGFEQAMSKQELADLISFLQTNH